MSFRPAFPGESNNVSYTFQYYHDANLVDVISNIISAGLKLGDHSRADVNYLVDAITGASRKDIHGSQIGPDGISGASIKSTPLDGIMSASLTSEKRRQVTGTFSYNRDFIKMLFNGGTDNDDPATLSLTGINSEENDYTSRTAAASVSQDLFQRNTTTAFSFSRSFDKYRPEARYVPVTANEGWDYFGDGKRLTDHFDAVLTQGITTTTVISLLAGYTYDRGYLSRPYYTYKIGNIYYHENLPAQHQSYTLTGKINQYIPLLKGCALHGTYRYYEDSWKMKSHTVEMELYSRIFDHIVLRPQLRWYKQNAAFFYQDVYTVPLQYMTTDFKYRSSNALSEGLKLSWELNDFVKPEGVPFFGIYPVSFDIGLDCYQRSGTRDWQVRNSHYNYWNVDKGFSSYWIQSGITGIF